MGFGMIGSSFMRTEKWTESEFRLGLIYIKELMAYI
jgi:hypothetical protein